MGSSGCAEVGRGGGMGGAKNSDGADGGEVSHEGTLWGCGADVVESGSSGVIVEGIVMTGGTREEIM